MHIIIPACGRGERFLAAGYDVVKPLIPVQGIPMVEKVKSSLVLKEEDNIHVVTNVDVHLDNVIKIDSQTCGAAETVLIAIESYLREEKGPVLIVDCDAIYNSDLLETFRRLENDSQIRAAVLCFEESNADQSHPPKYSYVEVNSISRVQSIAEKIRISKFANTGAYWFADIQEFREVTKAMILEEKYKYAKEAYISCVLQEYLHLEKDVKACEIKEHEYDNIGTPDCLEKYLEKQNNVFLFDLDGTIVNTEVAYTDAWYKLLKDKGACVTSRFFVEHISGLSDAQVSQNFNIDLNSELKDKFFLSSINKVTEVPGAVSFVRQCEKIGLVCIVTNSNGAAARAILRKFDLEDIPLIASEDVRLGKPNSEPYTKALRKLGASHSTAIVFEDSRAGFIAARAANCRYVVSVSSCLNDSDTHIKDFSSITPVQLIDKLTSVSHLSDELSLLMGRRSVVFPVRVSGGYIADILSASCGMQRFILKLENHDQGVLRNVSEHLNLHSNECTFYQRFAKIAPVRTPCFYGVLEDSKAIVLEDLSCFDIPPEFSLEVALKVIDAIANVHTHFHGAPLEHLAQKSDFMITFMKENFCLFESTWENTVGGQTMTLFRDVVYSCEDSFNNLKSPPVTLIHGDFKLPNMFWDTSAGGKPIFIDWQYATTGKGIEDIVFMLVESCPLALFADLAKPIIKSYYDKIQHLSGVTIPSDVRTAETKCALSGFPLFVAIWFGTIDRCQLVDPNFPFLYITRIANAFRILLRD